MMMFSHDERSSGDPIRAECLRVLITLADEAHREYRKKDCEKFIEQVYALLDE